MSKEEIREKALEQARKEIKGSFEKDKFIVKTVKFLNQIKSTVDSEMESFRDLYSVYFPELTDEVTDDDELYRILQKGLRREDLDSFEEMADNSTGADLPEREMKIIEDSFGTIHDRKQLSEKLEEYLEETVNEEMPNLSKLMGPVLTAKLLGHTGSLEDLAKKPASTVQMLGAEKALFRYLRGKGTPPKHGVIFEHEFVSGLPEGQRGKMARFLANKAVMAARLDYYGDKDKGEQLRKEASQKFEELKE